MPMLDIDMWLTPQDVERSNKGEFINEGEFLEIPQGENKPPRKVFEIGVKLEDGSRRVWIMSKTNQRTIARAYGPDTKNWIGRSFELFILLQNINGIIKKVIYVKPPVSEKYEEKV